MKFLRGFTLIELLVVIAIIALLSSVVLASLSTARMKARDAKRIDDIKQIKLALENYYDDNNYYPVVFGSAQNTNSYACSYTKSSWDDLSTKLGPYISKLPIDSINSGCSPWNNNCYSYCYGNVADGVVTGPNLSGYIGYDLVAQLETPNHPQSCGQIPGGYRHYFNRFSWCGSYSKQLYGAF